MFPTFPNPYESSPDVTIFPNDQLVHNGKRPMPTVFHVLMEQDDITECRIHGTDLGPLSPEMELSDVLVGPTFPEGFQQELTTTPCRTQIHRSGVEVVRRSDTGRLQEAVGSERDSI